MGWNWVVDSLLCVYNIQSIDKWRDVPFFNGYKKDDDASA